ncbi:MAG: fold-3 domain protein [Rhizobium sp.]|nr:fold-3 domain protein [Rhizobium sp.]
MPKPRNKSNPVQHSINSTGPAAEASGIFTWIIGTDTVYSDALAADAFGFDRETARSGLPFKDYLSRMHPDDLPRVAMAIHDTIISGLPFGEQYRIGRPDGSSMEVMAFGSCFRDASGEPSHYSGIIMPSDAAARGENAIAGHLLAAYDLARREDKSELASKIADALIEIGWQKDNADTRQSVSHLH